MKHYRIKAVCMLLCLIMIFSSLSGTVLAEGEEDRERIIVSMGDSYSSGEGIEPFYGQDLPLSEKIEEQDWLAHRSKDCWSGMLVLDGKKMSEHRNENWYFVAASGAETKDINGRQPKDGVQKVYTTLTVMPIRVPFSDQLDPQIDVFYDYNLTGRVDYVTLTLGGNDAGFVDVVKEGALDRLDFIDLANLSNKLNGIWNSFYEDGGIRDDLRKAYTDIHEAAGPQAKIIVAGYPKLFDLDGWGLLSRENKEIINESVSRFNAEIETLVNSCKASDMKICFVSVESAFDGKGADAKGSFLNGIYLGAKSEDLDQTSFVSSYSMHPNYDGAKAYAECVQAKIDSIEKDGGKSEWPDMFGSEVRDVVLVLDASGSMEGRPMEETKKAAVRFADTIMYEDVGIGAVIYDVSAQTIAGFSKNKDYLDNVIQDIRAGGGTNIEAGLRQARELFDTSIAENKFIVLMSDGEPNEGKVGDELIEYADSLKAEGFRIYTLGFFSDLSYYEKAEAQALMEAIATDGCHYEVDDAEQLVFFFEDLADQLTGTKYYYIRIACPVDVTVTYNGETLSSRDAYTSQRTSFGTMTFEESDEPSDSPDNRIKTLRLKEGVNYDITIEGNGEGTMSYTIGFMDDEGEYSDLRTFDDISITRSTKIQTTAAYSDSTTMKVDEDGDGKVDYVYRAAKNGAGEKYDYRTTLLALLLPVAVWLLLIVIIIIAKSARRKKRKKTAYAR